MKDKDLRQKALKMLMQKSLVKKKKEPEHDREDEEEDGAKGKPASGGKSVTVTVSY